METKISKEDVRKVAPPMPEGMISIVMSHEDMRVFANLMSICAQTFEKLALQAAQESDEPSFTVLQSRYKLSSVFAQKLVEACKMPEPVSRDFH